MRMYLSNLPLDVSEQDIASELLHDDPCIQNIRLVRDRFTGSSRGFCFVEFVQPSFCAQTIASLNGVLYRGCKLNASIAESKRHFNEPLQYVLPEPDRSEKSGRRRKFKKNKHSRDDFDDTWR